MSLHAGSSAMAHNLDRFVDCLCFEDIAGEAARLGVSTDTVRFYLDLYGEEPVTILTRDGTKTMSAWEAEVKWQVLGQKVRWIK